MVTMVTMVTMCTLVTFELQVDEFVLDVQTGPLLPPLAPPMLYKWHTKLLKTESKQNFSKLVIIPW